MTNVYENEFDSTGHLGPSVSKYLASSIFIFQLFMCGVFTLIIEANNIVVASVIVVVGEIFYMIAFGFFEKNINELRESLDDIRKDQDQKGRKAN